MSAGESGSASESTPLLPDEYEDLLEHVRETVESAIPRNATVLVVSRGDDEMLKVGPRRALHFPHDEFGRYVGYHPEDSDAAIAGLEDMRARGGAYLLFPRTAFWWLDYYEGLKDHLQSRYRAIAANPECMVFELVAGVQPPPADADNGGVPAATTSPELGGPLDELVRALVPADAGVAVAASSAAVLPSFPACHAVPSYDRFATLTGAAESRGAQFLVIPASARDRVHGGMPPPDTAGAWRLVTRQRFLGEVWERSAVGGRRSAESTAADSRLPTADPSLLRRLLRRLR